VARQAVLWLDIAVKIALVALLVHAVVNPDLPQYSGKAMLGRALTYPIAIVLVPAVWWLGFRRRPYPALVDLLITTPFLIDVAGNAWICDRSGGGTTSTTSSTGCSSPPASPSSSGWRDSDV
jgi:hypothetical protein